MPQIGWQELVIILALALLVMGPRRLPELARSLGGAMREFKAGVQGLGAAGVTTSEGGAASANPGSPRDWEALGAGDEEGLAVEEAGVTARPSALLASFEPDAAPPAPLIQ